MCIISFSLYVERHEQLWLFERFFFLLLLSKKVDVVVHSSYCSSISFVLYFLAVWVEGGGVESQKRGGCGAHMCALNTFNNLNPCHLQVKKNQEDKPKKVNLFLFFIYSIYSLYFV